LIVLHGCCKVEGFGDLVRNKHGFEDKTWDQYVAKILKEFKAQIEAEDWNIVINICSSISAFTHPSAFPSRLPDFKPFILPLISICANKTDMLRKNAAVCLARLANEDGNKKFMIANHGMEVLSSLKNCLKI
jgi:hypothetical protein